MTPEPPPRSPDGEPQHIPTCAVGHVPATCPRPHDLSDGVHHWWSGWPGAYCLGCGAEDAVETCLGTGCACPCHGAIFGGED